MKTFIWNTETTVYISVAENIEKAKRVLSHQFIKQSKNDLLDEKDRTEEPNKIYPSYVLFRAECIIGNDFCDFLEIWDKEPDYILEDNKSIIYQHLNE